MSSPSFEASLSQLEAASAAEPAESSAFIHLDVGRLLTFKTVKLTEAEASAFRKDQSKFISGFEGGQLVLPDGKLVDDLYVGTVPSGYEEKERERISIKLFEPGVVTRGLSRAARLLRRNSMPKATLYIENLDRALD